MKKISFQKAKEIMDTDPNCVILDVRDEAEYITGHVLDAQLCPVGEMTEEDVLDLIPSYDTQVLVYCRTGKRSFEACLKLEDYGYTNIYDLGSLVGWPYGLC